MKPHPKLVVSAGDSYLKDLFVFPRLRLAACHASKIQLNQIEFNFMYTPTWKTSTHIYQMCSCACCLPGKQISGYMQNTPNEKLC